MNLSNEFQVGLQILYLETPTFSKLVKILNGRISRNEISISLDILNDLGLIKENYVKRDKVWRREIYLTKDAKNFFEDIKTKSLNKS